MATAQGHEAAAWQADASNADQVQACVAEITQRFGRIDILHSNAGVMTPSSALSLSLDEWGRRTCLG